MYLYILEFINYNYIIYINTKAHMRTALQAWSTTIVKSNILLKSVCD